ncbi:MAG: outer membrane lipoprotein chaperone LolA [Rhodocyclaceae bacterium]|nr:outer membrane lipoprotein chaperone LolA [Rhodocyclaceae bacterium]
MHRAIRLVLFCIFPFLALAAEASGLDQINAFIAETRTAQGSFSQTVVAKSGRKPKQSSGTFALHRPGKFRWSYDKPYPQLLVSDGETFWSYDPDLNQVVTRKLGKSLGASPAALLAGGDLESSFELKDGGNADGLEWVEATPRAQDASFQKVRIGLKNRLPQAMEINDNFGQTTLLRFTRFEPNSALAPGLFRFAVPKGADVVGE